MTFLWAYEPPYMTDECFETDINLGLYRISEEYNNYVVLWDLNYDMLEKSKGSICCVTLAIWSRD